MNLEINEQTKTTYTDIITATFRMIKREAIYRKRDFIYIWFYMFPKICFILIKNMKYK